MTLVEIINIVKELGVTVVMLGAVIYLLVKYFSNLIDSKVAKNKNIPEEVQAVQYNSVKCLKQLHPFFDKVDGIIETKLPITTIGGPVRTEIFRDVLTIFYKTAKDVIKELLDKDITMSNFLTENYKAANQIISESNKRMRESGIPEVVIIKFNQWNNDRHEYILSTISDVDSSEVFSTVVEKEYAILNLYTNSSYFVLIDAERTLKSLNGDLTGTVYKGKIVENLHN